VETVIWRRISSNKYESPQGYKARQTHDGWELTRIIQNREETTWYKNFSALRRAAQKMSGFDISETPMGIDGRVRTDPIGYCCYHTCYLSHTDAKKHGCLKKSCSWLVKISSTHWDRRDEIKRNKKSKKACHV
jgi:hypothetical protein